MSSRTRRVRDLLPPLLWAIKPRRRFLPLEELGVGMTQHKQKVVA
jgi:hypothetical protein